MVCVNKCGRWGEKGREKKFKKDKKKDKEKTKYKRNHLSHITKNKTMNVGWQLSCALFWCWSYTKLISADFKKDFGNSQLGIKISTYIFSNHTIDFYGAYT